MKRALAAFTLPLLAGAALAQSSPVGLWRNIDDHTGKAKAEIRIEERAGVLVGRVEKTLVTSESPTCDLCTDDRKGKPILGLEIIRGVHQAKDDANVWEGGKILDPENGKEYRTRLTPIDGGKKLQVRGYLGPFFRTQIWNRVP
ncbi:MAG: DUF2147 domain-containing protein [Burkholderiaceae bacterium]|jgi:uncharacterized protein (DUF2147 family)|nr:DUF2147 domain-containing protein [Burkholderiaceae bacterium]